MSFRPLLLGALNVEQASSAFRIIYLVDAPSPWPIIRINLHGLPFDFYVDGFFALSRMIKLLDRVPQSNEIRARCRLRRLCNFRSTVSLCL